MNLLPPAIRSIPCILWLASCGPSLPEVPQPVGDRGALESPGAVAKAPPADSGGMAFAIVHRDSETKDACPLDRAVAALGAGCERLPATQMWGARAPAATQAAFDGDGCTVWNSGGPPPQAAGMDLGEPVEIAGLLLLPEMTPDGKVTHVIEISTDGRSFERIGSIQAPMQTGVPYEMRLPEPAIARFIRVVTTESPSWVAWRDIVAVRCHSSR